MSKSQFQEDGYENIHNLYRKGVVVECPRCRHCAYVKPSSTSAARITCVACGYSKEIGDRSSWSYPSGINHYSQSQLWLQVQSCGETLWALNQEQLAWLEGYVSADLRTQDTKSECVNSCLNSRIPRWISSKKNREQVMAGIQKLKARLPKST